MLDRLRRPLPGALAGLVVLLAALVVLGAVVLPAVRPLPIPEVEGAPLVVQRATGTGASGSLVLRGDPIRSTAACDLGSRALVEVEDVGDTGHACGPDATGGIVLSDVAPGRHAWRLTATPAARWAMVLSTPVVGD